MSSKAIYLRVSKKELDEEKQLTEITRKFNPKDAFVFQEKVSAYDEEKQEKRHEFQRLKQMIVDGEVTEVYIFSIERLERNIVRLFEFYFFCEAHNCKIFSVMQDIPNRKINEKPMDTFLRYINVLLFGYKGQEESYTTSYRTKSAAEKDDNNNTFSYKGNKWGKPFKDLQGENVILDEEGLAKLQDTILSEIKRNESLKRSGYYNLIIQSIADKFNIKISKSYITQLRKK